MARFEDRHCELREAEVAARPASLGMSPERLRALEQLDAFEVRTGPLVDDLVAAARELHDAHLLRVGPDESMRERHRAVAALRRLSVALAALDEASDG